MPKVIAAMIIGRHPEQYGFPRGSKGIASLPREKAKTLVPGQFLVLEDVITEMDDHLSGVAHNFPEPGSWLNEEITCAE